MTNTQQKQSLQSLALKLASQAQVMLHQGTTHMHKNNAECIFRALMKAIPEQNTIYATLHDQAVKGEFTMPAHMPVDEFHSTILSFYKILADQTEPQDFQNLNFVTRCMAQAANEQNLAKQLFSIFEATGKKLQAQERQAVRDSRPKVYPAFITGVMTADQKQKGYYSIATQSKQAVKLFVSDPEKLPEHLRDNLPFEIINAFPSEDMAIKAGKYCNYLTVGKKKDKDKKGYSVIRERNLSL